ncbi:substrate-binding periplasmic protein [Marinobacter lacisalsi]|uniref:Substrate-binding periplasmic protein n=1 Tax=Marinobacter lacisalsi TaxID=475979 RepID=A0ABV8QGS3_9GAMM
MSKLRTFFRDASFVTMIASSLMPFAYAADRPVIRSAYIEFPPLAYTTESGELEGSFIDLTEAIADRAGYDIVWQGLPIERVYLYLEYGEIDMWPGSAGIPELAPFIRETDFHTGSIQLNAYSRAGAEPVSEIQDLRGKSLILIRGYTYFRLLDHLKEDPDTGITIAPNHLSAIRMLAFERGDYLINFQSPMENSLEISPLPGLRYDNLLKWPTTLIFSRNAPGTDKMLEDMNRAWRSMKEEGARVEH